MDEGALVSAPRTKQGPPTLSANIHTTNQTQYIYIHSPQSTVPDILLESTLEHINLTA